MTSIVRKSLKNSGRARSSTVTSGNLLPTPSVKGNYRKKGQGKSGNGLSTSLREDFPASPSVRPDEEKERMMSAISGLKCSLASGYSGPNGSSLKMLRDSLLGTMGWYSKPCALTWKVKVTKYNRSLFQLVPSKRPIDGTEFGLLRTPNTNGRGTRSDEGMTKGHQLELQDQIRMLPTPDTQNHRDGTKLRKDNNMAEGGSHSVSLHHRIEAMMPTPATRDWKGGSKQGRDTVDSLIERGATKGQSGATRTGLKLHPDFVEWMQGYPQGWTALPDSKLLEIRSSLRLQRKYSDL